MHEINERGGDSHKMMEYARKAYKYMQKFVEALEEEGGSLDERYNDDERFGERGDRDWERDEMQQRRGVRGTGRYSRYR